MARRKLPNGTGSIVKLGKSHGKKRLSPWMARLPATYDEDGKEIRKIVGCFKTYNDAFDALTHYEEKEEERLETLKEIYETWKGTNEYKTLTKSTKSRYEGAFQRFEALHNTPIKDIKYYQLQRVVDDMEADGYDKRNRKGEMKHHEYSKSSIERLKHLLSKLYTYALKNDLVQTNLAPLLVIGGLKVQRKKEIFTREEIEKLFFSTQEVPFARHILILIFTGMRTGEYYDLKKSNISLKENKIKNFGEKTEAGKARVLFIHPKIKHILSQLVAESKTGYIYEKEGVHVSSTRFYEQYYDTLEKLGIEEKIPYSCRYTFATIAHNSGVADKTLQSLMGHTNFNITANSYIQDLDEYVYSELSKIDI